MNRITSLYPQYRIVQDRRQQNVPVAIERRSGTDRRSTDRVALDTQLTRDIFEVKSKVAKLEALAPKLFERNPAVQAPSFGAMNNLGQDQMVKETKPDMAEIARQEAKLQDKASTAFQVGVLSAALAGAIALSFMGSAGAVIAIGTAVYIGARALKIAVAKELKDSDSVTKKN